MRRLGTIGLVGIVLFVVGVAVFVVEIVRLTADAPSGRLSATGIDTPWLLLAAIGCWVVGLLLVVFGSSRARAGGS